MANEIRSQVNIKLISTIRPSDGESESYEMWLKGQLLEKAGSLYLKYDEVQEDKTIRTTMKLGHEKALIMRAGSVNMRLPLNIIEQQKGHYESEFGSMPLIIDTKKMTFTKQALSGDFHVQYDLLMGGQSVGNYTLDITFTEVQ
ncbi:MAG TPA: DUF1934 domain-containing protein [Lysinibacillus sp.]|jgi:uncharacterized beta-barrel protein YwiB (DUF1934 family)|uniref:DUF1934 domain-containing protein n=1 Tax=Lysinibacillus fusiformis TaxID=28031 RepID=A0A2I0V633_9BACI|nr:MULTISPECIES: DUF1934 domain-containing protein [Lysinibacillus]HBT73420.1 DUF1934 domain-containing protein [Lysinibacillus sp.]KUF32846.1 hypothetical protein AK833_11900 [Lysinibacillus sp. F5]PKU53746.1 DUF1934 domain-containing protein [Lysinibacillus fusiformis]WCH48303.1 DUF1934 domain-containing protein [Lysinibacillus sp. OF-1]SCY49350.1 Uncharacterized beta-barrel protein YwiB, DUF1934 family [Lysinibacillus sp. SG9]